MFADSCSKLSSLYIIIKSPDSDHFQWIPPECGGAGLVKVVSHACGQVWFSASSVFSPQRRGWADWDVHSAQQYSGASKS